MVGEGYIHHSLTRHPSMRTLTHTRKNRPTSEGSFVNRAAASILRRPKASNQPSEREAASDNHAFSSGPQFSFGRVSVFSQAPARLQPKLAVNEPGDSYEKEADLVAAHVMRMPAPALQKKCACGAGAQRQNDLGDDAHLQTKQRGLNSSVPFNQVPGIVRETLQSPGQPLDAGTRNFMESRFGYNFDHVRVHTGSGAEKSARAVNALAYTVGRDVVFGKGQYAPASADGQQLLAHELTHVMQQEGGTLQQKGNSAPAGIQRRVAMRDVGRGEQSGFARVGELIARLNAISTGLDFAVTGGELTYTLRVGGHLSEFDRQMQGFIDQDAVIPLRFTNRHGLLGDRVTGFNDRVFEDAWASGYVDIDDLLASSDLGLQSVLVHFLRERSATRNYARRIGSTSLDTRLPAPAREFARAHALGIEAEVAVLRDFFGDPTIRFISEPGVGGIARVYRNSRRDRIRTRVRSQGGVDAVTIDVLTTDGRVLTPEEYRDLLEAERIRQQVERERLGGAAEHFEGGRGVPAP